MQKNIELEKWLKGIPVQKITTIPNERTSKVWREVIRQSGKRLGIRVKYISDNGKYYIIRMS